MRAPSPRAAATWTWLLAGVLALIAGIELTTATRASWPLLDFALSTWPYVLGIAGLFALSELGLVHIEFRHQAYSCSLSGIPMVLGVLTGTPTHLVLARVLGAAGGLRPAPPGAHQGGLQRLRLRVRGGDVATAIHWLAPVGAQLDLADRRLCCLVVAGVDLVMSLLVVVVISLHGTRLGAREIVQILVPAAIFSAASTACALVAALLIESGPLGVVLLGIAAPRARRCSRPT